MNSQPTKLTPEMIEQGARALCALGVPTMNGKIATWERHADGLRDTAEAVLRAALSLDRIVREPCSTDWRELIRCACNCMVAFTDPLPPGEHAHDCPVRLHGVLEYRSIDPQNPHGSDDCWTRDCGEAQDEVDAFHALGATGYRLDWRVVLNVAS